jgi:hypothetical protein
MHAAKLACLSVIACSVVLAQTPGRSGTPSPNSPQRVPVRNLGEQCIDLGVTFSSPPRECTVTDLGELGMVGGKLYRYAIYCLLPNWAEADEACGERSSSADRNSHRAVVVSAELPGSRVATIVWKRAYEDIDDVIFEPPELIRTNAGTLLYMPIRGDGTAAENLSEYFLWRSWRWEPLDGRAWLSDEKFVIPAGLQMRKSPWPNVRAMKAEFRLHLPDDAYCCPSGPMVKVTLKIRGNQLALASFVLDESKPQ